MTEDTRALADAFFSDNTDEGIISSQLLDESENFHEVCENQEPKKKGVVKRRQKQE